MKVVFLHLDEVMAIHADQITLTLAVARGERSKAEAAVFIAGHVVPLPNPER